MKSLKNKSLIKLESKHETETEYETESENKNESGSENESENESESEPETKEVVREETLREANYRQNTELEHVINKPGMYVGSTKKQTTNVYLFDEKSQSFIHESVSFVPAWYKIVDEVLVNAIDHWVNYPKKVNIIKIDFSTKTGNVRIYNNGPGISLDKFKNLKGEYIYIPQAIASEFRMGDNLDPDKERITGGTHGLGLKLANAYSDMLEITTQKKMGRKIQNYTQTFKNRLSEIGTPQITEIKFADVEKIKENNGDLEFTNIKFRPCYEKMGYTGGVNEAQMNDMLKLVQTRAYQALAFVDTQIIFNGKLLKLENPQLKSINNKGPNKFISFANMFMGENSSHGIYYTVLQYTANKDAQNKEVKKDTQSKKMQKEMQKEAQKETQKDIKKNMLDWHICIGISDGKSRQVSLINGIYVYGGGSHIKYIQNQIVSGIKPKVEKLIGKKNKFNQNYILNNLFIVFKAFFINPTFNGQIKHELNEPIENFANFQFKDKDMTAIWKFLEPFISAQFLDKELPAQKTKVNRGIINTNNGQDAKFAGHKTKAKECSFIVCEGNSARGTVLSGINHKTINQENKKLNLDYIGTFSIQGVPMNSRKECNIKTDPRTKMRKIIRNEKLKNNERFKDLEKHLGLDYSKTYNPDTEEGRKEIETLRYGRVICAVDQDLDGKGNIFGLILNHITLFWSNLIRIGFVKRLNTPIVRICKKNQRKECIHEFYTINAYSQWIEERYGGDKDRLMKEYDAHYYKGLGSHDQKYGEIYRIFTKFEENLLTYHLDDLALENLEKTYGKSSEARKEILSEPIDITFELKSNEVDISDFIKTDVKEYQFDNIKRKIPHFADGLVPSRRKALFYGRKCFGIGTQSNKAIKASEFISGVSGNTNYHHGEESLSKTIIGMCQDFPGANNLPLFIGEGNYGSRNEGGDDHAAARYLKIKLNQKLCNRLFPPEDDYLLEYEEEDGQSFEPKYYVPLLPMAIMENMEVPATGWKAKIWGQDYKKIINNVRGIINGTQKKSGELGIWLRKNSSRVIEWDDKLFALGSYKYDQKNNEIIINELPPCVYDKSYVASVVYASGKDAVKEEEVKKGKGKKKDSKIIAKPEFTGYHPIKSNYDENTNRYEVKIILQLTDGAYEKILNNANLNRAVSANPDYPFTVMEEFLKLKNRLDFELNFIGDDGVVMTFGRYQSVLHEWYLVRRRLYSNRIDRLIALHSLKVKYLENQIRFTENHKAYNINPEMDNETFVKIMKSNKYDTFDRALLFNPEYTKIEELTEKILYGKNASYDYLFDLSIRQLAKKSCDERKKELEREKKKLEKVLLDTSNENGHFKGKFTWLEELEQLERVIDEGLENGWN